MLHFTPTVVHPPPPQPAPPPSLASFLILSHPQMSCVSCPCSALSSLFGRKGSFEGSSGRSPKVDHVTPGCSVSWTDNCLWHLIHSRPCIIHQLETYRHSPALSCMKYKRLLRDQPAAILDWIFPCCMSGLVQGNTRLLGAPGSHDYLFLQRGATQRWNNPFLTQAQAERDYERDKATLKENDIYFYSIYVGEPDLK